MAYSSDYYDIVTVIINCFNTRFIHAERPTENLGLPHPVLCAFGRTMTLAATRYCAAMSINSLALSQADSFKEAPAPNQALSIRSTDLALRTWSV